MADIKEMVRYYRDVYKSYVKEKEDEIEIMQKDEEVNGALIIAEMMIRERLQGQLDAYERIYGQLV